MEGPLDRWVAWPQKTAGPLNCTVKKEKKIFLIHREIQKGAVAKSYMTKKASPYMTKYLPIFSSYITKPFLIYDFAPNPVWISLHMRKILFYFLSVQFS